MFVGYASMIFLGLFTFVRVQERSLVVYTLIHNLLVPKVDVFLDGPREAVAHLLDVEVHECGGHANVIHTHVHQLDGVDLDAWTIEVSDCLNNDGGDANNLFEVLQ
jgi:hypothetical protein